MQLAKPYPHRIALRIVIETLAMTMVITALAGCAGYVPGRQAYWDAQVKEMCEKDGG